MSLKEISIFVEKQIFIKGGQKFSNDFYTLCENGP